MTAPEWVQMAYQMGLVGAGVGYLRWGQAQNGKDISSIKKMLGVENGHPPAFVRREQYDDAVRRLEDELTELRSRLV